MKRSRLCALLAAVWLFGLFSLLGVGCAPGNVVHLSYPAGKTAEQASPEAAKSLFICVVDFENKRKQAAIGERLDGEKLVPRTLVERWMASSLAQELQHAGYRAVVAETLESALGQSPDFIVTGESEEVWLAETSLTRYTGAIRASIILLDGKGRAITKNSYSSVYSKTILPVYGVPQTLLNEALVEMLQPASKLLIHMMQ